MAKKAASQPKPKRLTKSALLQDLVARTKLTM